MCVGACFEKYHTRSKYWAPCVCVTIFLSLLFLFWSVVFEYYYFSHYRMYDSFFVITFSLLSFITFVIITCHFWTSLLLVTEYYIIILAPACTWHVVNDTLNFWSNFAIWNKLGYCSWTGISPVISHWNFILYGFGNLPRPPLANRKWASGCACLWFCSPL